MLRRYYSFVRLLWWIAPGPLSLCVLLTLLTAASGTATVVVTGRLVEALAGNETTAAWVWFGATAGALIAGPIGSALLTAAGEALSARFLVASSDMAFELSTGPDGIDHLETARPAERLAAVMDAPRDWLFVGGTTAVWQIATLRLTGVGALVVLVQWSWWPSLIVLGGWWWNRRAMGRWTAAAFDDVLDVAGVGRHRARYLQSLLTRAEPAKELRLFGLTGWLVDRYTHTWRSTMDVIWARRTTMLRGALGSVGAILVANGVAFAALVRDAWRGDVSVGSTVTLVQALLALSAFGALYGEAAVARMTSILAEIVRLRHERGLPAHPSTDHTPRDLPVQEPVPAGIELRDVTYRYASQTRPTIGNLDLRIPAGQAVALVGVNGVGKSTLIKLLCGLYQPESGVVQIDGETATSRDRPRVAAIFQDFVHYHLSLRDNIGFGVPNHAVDDAVLERALTDAGARPLLRELANGWDTALSAEYAGGTDLSGGQWQRVALARALAALAAGAGVLVLDEPTAAQDVRAEAALFDRFLAVTRGVTTILVSHRLSSVRRADRILVLDDPDCRGARIVEDGSHDELLTAGGTYAHLFRIQAARFAEQAETC